MSISPEDSPLDQYRNVMSRLLTLREAAGGELPDKIEALYMGRLDELWWQLSEAEQEECELLLSAKILSE